MVVQNKCTTLSAIYKFSMVAFFLGSQFSYSRVYLLRTGQQPGTDRVGVARHGKRRRSRTQKCRSSTAADFLSDQSQKVARNDKPPVERPAVALLV